MYPLEEKFRAKMGLPEGSGLGAIAITSGIEGGDWAEKEFGGARLGDKRLSRRLVEIAADKAGEPGRSFSGVTEGDWPRVKGYYRFIDKPDDSAVTMSAILQPHRERTIQRTKAQKTVLCIQDGSDLNYSTLERCEGLGTIGTNQTGKQSGGLHLHSTLVVTTEGLPLGVLRAECVAREAKPHKDARPLPAIPIEEKNTFSWIAGVRDCMDIKPLTPRTTLVSVMDREADFFEIFDEQRRKSYGVELLIRAQHNRKTTGNHKLFDEVIQSPVQAQITIKIQRQSARAKKKNQKARNKREARTAEVSVRYIRTELKPPPYFQDMTQIPLCGLSM